MLALVEADSETTTLIKTPDICRELQPQVASADISGRFSR